MIPGVVASQITILKTVNPIITYTTSTSYWTAKITNKDPSMATIYENADVTPPTTSRGTAEYNATVTGDTIIKIEGGTWYAKAKVSGQTDSDIVSITMDPVF